MSDAPYGVIFTDDKRAIVGVPHGYKIPLGKEVEARIRKIGDTYGYWYEGNGGDKKSFAAKYVGSWDDDLADTIEGFPYEFLGAMFGNAHIDAQIKALTSMNKTIFESIIDNQRAVSYFKDRKFTAATLTKYLTAVSEKDYDFTRMANKIATRPHLKQFFRVGMQRAFPKNWQDFPYPAGKVSKLVLDRRGRYLLSRDSGVYFVGAGHIRNLKQLDPKLVVHGGEKSN